MSKLIDNPSPGGGGGNTGSISAGTTNATLGEVVFSNSNGVSFGINGNTLTATVATNYQSQGAYLTTAMASNRGSDFVNTTAGLNLTNISATLGSNSLSFSVGNYITTAMLSNAATISNINVSGGTTSSNLSAFKLIDSNGVSWSLDTGSKIYATVKTDYLTTAMASNRGTDFVQANAAFAGTSASGTIASNGISVSIGPYITTAMASNRGTDFVQATAGFNGTNCSGTIASNSISVSVGNYITTAALSNHSHGVSFTSGSTVFQTLSFTNSNGISFNSGTQGIFGSHNAITTGRASTDAIGLNTAQSNVTWTVNSSGLSLDARGYAGTGTTFAGANISGSITQNSAGLNLSMSVAAPGAAAENNWVTLGGNILGNSSASGSTINWIGGQNITLSGTNNSQVEVRGVSFANSNGVTFGHNAGTVTASIPLNATFTQRYQWPLGNLSVVAAMGNGSFSLNRVQVDQDLSATRLDVPFLVSLASSATANTWGLAVTAFAAVYTKNVSTLSSLSSGSNSFSLSLASNSAGQTQVIAHAIRPISVGFNMSMSPGEYYVGFGISTKTSSAGTATTALGNTWSVMGGPVYSSAVGQVGEFTDTTNTSTGLFGGQGVYSAAISTVPPTVSLSAINQTGSYYARGMMGLLFRNI